ncbi:MAG: HlyC/CorC family transporter [Gammaproteobacteria bacterium]|nr:HlyC/CorC family transporter [Gammaproteobacteria bacterium]|tara:strand:+ start:1390 stop:2652 length:1263 start_codon:yes stop_codon:yes gene_type:complete
MNSEETSLFTLLLSFVILILASAYFSSSETSMMSLNRYRLNHLSRTGHNGARRAKKLLETPDKLIGVILIGNNFVNFLAASIATSIALRVFGNPSPLFTALVLTMVVLIFAEVTPKTIAALHPEKVAYPSSHILRVLLTILYPAVYVVNTISNLLLSLLGINVKESREETQLSPEELRTVVNESTERIPRQRHGMLLNVLDLETVTVNDIMVPRNEIVGIDIEDDLAQILQVMSNSQHTRIPIYKGNLDNVVAILHLRNASKLINVLNLSKSAILQEAMDPYFIPENAALHTQLLKFQEKKMRIAIVVDEYGATKGIATLEDILEEIVGEFTTDLASIGKEIHAQDDGKYLIDGAASIRDINRILGWDLDTEGAKTLNGLLTEILETIPDSSVGINLGKYLAEIIHTKDNVIRTAKMWER